MNEGLLKSSYPACHTTAAKMMVVYSSCNELLSVYKSQLSLFAYMILMCGIIGWAAWRECEAPGVFCR